MINKINRISGDSLKYNRRKESNDIFFKIIICQECKLNKNGQCSKFKMQLINACQICPKT